MSSTTLPVCPKTGSTSPSLTVHLCLHTALLREIGNAPPTEVTWEESFGEEERARVCRAVRSAIGVDLPHSAADAGRRSSSVRRRAVQRRRTRASAVRGNDWRRLVMTEPEDFTPLWPVSVVVFGRITPEALGRTLAAIERQSYPSDLVEVVIVDAAPAARAPLAPAAATVRWIRCPDGEAAARNAGARAANHDILLFLDAGLAPEPGWLAGHAQWHHRVSDVVTVESRVVSGTGPAAPAEWAGALCGAPFGIGRRFFELVDGFDAALAGRERQDVEFGRRACTCGGLLAPARAAGDGAGYGAAHPAPVAEPARPAAGPVGTAPRWLVVLEVLPGGGAAAMDVIERLLSEGGSSVAILVDAGEAVGDARWLRAQDDSPY